MLGKGILGADCPQKKYHTLYILRGDLFLVFILIFLGGGFEYFFSQNNKGVYFIIVIYPQPFYSPGEKLKEKKYFLEARGRGRARAGFSRFFGGVSIFIFFLGGARVGRGEVLFFIFLGVSLLQK